MTITTRRKSNTFYIILIAGATALGGFLFGFDTVVINGAVVAVLSQKWGLGIEPVVGVAEWRDESPVKRNIPEFEMVQ